MCVRESARGVVGEAVLGDKRVSNNLGQGIEVVLGDRDFDLMPNHTGARLEGYEVCRVLAANSVAPDSDFGVDGQIPW